MIIVIRYDNGRIDTFDTVSFTAPQPFPTKNMLTNFELKLDELGATGLWLTAHYYDVDPSYRADADSSVIPVARRKMGWRFLLAQADEVDRIRIVEMDGSVVMRRIAGQLVDYARFEERAKVALGDKPSAISERILALYDYVERENRVLGRPSDADAVAQELGLTVRMVSDIESSVAANEGYAKDDWEELGDEGR